ncbi:HTH domain-containing protein [Bradyrhizobium aeschynomenes]|uniref:HTH domain-containing protein n=1 Tax=Bradyrhizobium aeschynomenes TaxID=2734909 RepID=UPI001FEF896B|nr:HTH domain-containing protein [Bradyrhizobium aeschynomenes]
MLFERPDLDQMLPMRGYETPIVLPENGHDRADGEGQTYLRVAEIVLSEALSPLKAREIVERGIEQGLFGDHVMSRTPEKSMQARLSIDILSQGKNSRFARTSKGRFTLRSKLSDSRDSEGGSEEDRVEYLAKRRDTPKVLRTPKEEVLCVDEQGFRDVLTFQGIDTDPAEILGRLLKDKHLHYVGRSEAETRDDAKQFITYVLVQCGQRLLFFSRSYLSRAAEFLRGSKCIGFGGHVSAADMDILSRGDRGLSACARRELAEELRLPERPKRGAPSEVGLDRATLQLFQGASLERLAVLNDDSSGVGRRHVAVVYRAWLSDWEQARRLQKGDSSIKGVNWIDLSKDTVDIAEYEYWSQLCLRKFYPSTVVAKAKFEVLNAARLLSDRIIAVSGRIGSGKSETASYLSERLDIPLIKTGPLLAELMGSPLLGEIGRAEFQTRALSFIRDERGPEKLAMAILDKVNALSKRRCLVDGIRNLSTYENLKAKTLGSLALLFVQTPPDLAFDMYRAREATGTLTFSYRDFLKVYDAPVEAEITSLGRNASAYIYNSFGLEAFRRTLDHVVNTISGADQ